MRKVYVKVEVENNWHYEKVNTFDLKDKRDKMEAYLEKLERFWYYFSEASEDESLPDEIYWALDRAYQRAYRMYRLLQDGLDAINEAIEAYDLLESNLEFVYQDVLENVKGVA